jgi:hypothetical protein
MGTPFKMKGHELPGPNQRSASPMKEPITAALIGAAASGLIGGTTSAIGAGAKKRKAKKAAAQEKAAAGAQQAGSLGVEKKSSKLV